MRNRLRKCFAFSACASLLLVCSCEKHPVGEDPEFQKEHVETGGSEENAAANNEAEQIPGSPTPKPTPPEFFPESTPR